MPTYEYICSQCDHEFETFQSITADALKDCPECQTASLRRKIGLGGGIIFKGGGFYETDFKDKKGSKSASDSPPTKAADSGSKAEA